MKKEFAISGMTCGSCVAKVKATLQSYPQIKTAQIQLEFPQAIIESEISLDLQQLNQLLSTQGDYVISLEENKKELAPLPGIGKAKKTEQVSKTFFATYKPLLIIVGFISGVSLLVQYPFEQFSSMLWMRHFMAGFFLVFSFFKLLNLKGFSNSYAMYDIVAAKWKPWGFIYPFVELILGVFYLIDVFPFETNLATAIILGISSIGVIESNINKKKIKCACLGDVWNLPMSTVTIIEDLTMVAMAIAMLFIV